MASVYPQATCIDGAVRLVFPYEPRMVEELKVFPAFARAYNPATKAWTIHEPYVERAINLFLRHFPHGDVFGEAERARYSAPPPPPFIRPQAAGPHATLFLLPTAPQEVIEAAYKALVKLHHPDRLPEPQRAAGTEKMKAINTAYAQLTTGERRAS